MIFCISTIFPWAASSESCVRGLQIEDYSISAGITDFNSKDKSYDKGKSHPRNGTEAAVLSIVAKLKFWRLIKSLLLQRLSLNDTTSRKGSWKYFRKLASPAVYEKWKFDKIIYFHVNFAFLSFCINQKYLSWPYMYNRVCI